MRIAVLTIFPDLFEPFVATSLVGRAIAEGLLEVTIHDLRAFATDRHRSVDDEPYGGGAGMVMMAPPWIAAVRGITRGGDWWRVLLSPQGELLNEAGVRELAHRGDLLLLCGRYEGLDERVRQTVVDQEISIGDYVVSGGELPAMILIEALSRQIPGVVGRTASVEQDSFRRGLLDFPHYTRPRVVAGLSVPEVLLSGDHEAIRRWRQRQALLTTVSKRPDLLEKARLTAEERAVLKKVQAEMGGRSD